MFINKILQGKIIMMYSKKDILRSLKELNYYIDEQILNNFIKNWKIDAIYEDEDGVEFFDNLSIVKIKKGISLKSQGYDNDEIIYHIGKILAEKHFDEVKEKPVKEKIILSNEILPASISSTEVKTTSFDTTNENLKILADVIAQKVTEDLSEILDKIEFSQNMKKETKLEQDNEKLSQKVEELLDDNKKLAQRVEQLEKRKNYFINFFKKYFTF